MANPEIQTVSIALSADEAIVLFEILAREIDGNNGSRLRPFTSHEGELWALNGLHSLLEKELVEPFSKDYSEQLSQARERLVKLNGAWPD